MTARSELLAAAESLRAELAGRDVGFLRAPITAIVWATVDLDRAELELGRVLEEPLEALPAPRDPGLGATVRVARPFGQPPEPALFLVEPDTEGRLAALLARHGEGVVAVDVDLDGESRRLALTSGPGGRPPSAPSGRPPSGAA